MLPQLVLSDLPNDLATDAKPARQGRHAAAPAGGADLGNVGFGKLGIVIAFAMHCMAVISAVGGVLFVSSPAQISDGAIGAVAIGKMSGYHAFRPWSDENFKNQDVDEECFDFASLGQADLQITVIVQDGLQPVPSIIEDFAWSLAMTAPNRSIVADAVARVAGNFAVIDNCFISHISQIITPNSFCQHEKDEKER